MRIVVTGGGTAGHVTPLLAVASELKAKHPKAEIRYVGSYGDRFGTLADRAHAIDGSWRILAGKFRRYHGVSKWIYVKDLRIVLRNIRDFFYFAIGCLQSVWLLLWWRPDVLFVKGGFVGLPVGLAAALLRIPIVTHDSDTLPGLTNRVLSRYARFSCVAMPEKFYTYDAHKMRRTGLPVRPEWQQVTPAAQLAAREKLQIPDNAFVISVIGGSLGAVRLNNAIMSIARSYLSDDDAWLLHVTGENQHKEINLFYESLPAGEYRRVLALPYSDELHLVTAASDIVVTRAGSTIHELSVQHKTTILVPNPVLTGGHQMINAKAIADMGGAIVVTEKAIAETHGNALLEAIERLKNNPKEAKQLADQLSMLAIPNATMRIVSVIEEAAR